MEDLLGQQTGTVTNELSNLTPLSDIHDLDFERGVRPPSSESWSSVRKSTIFGDLFGAGKDNDGLYATKRVCKTITKMKLLNGFFKSIFMIFYKVRSNQIDDLLLNAYDNKKIKSD